MTVTIGSQGLQITVTRQSYNATSLSPTYEPDPDWSYEDDEGHLHEWNEDGEIPTTKMVVVDEWWCGECAAFHYEREQQCKECGEEIDPGRQITRQAGEPVYMAGPVEVTGVATRSSPVYDDIRETFESGEPINIELENGSVLQDVIATKVYEDEYGRGRVEFRATGIEQAHVN